MIVAGQLEQARVEAHVLADALEDHAFQVVIEQDAWDAAEGGKGLDVAAENTLQRLVEGEAGVHGPGPGQHEDETGQAAAGGADRDRAEVAPVDLALLPRQRIEAEERLGARGGADEADVTADLHGRAQVAARAEHRVQARRAQAWIRLERGGDDGLVGIEPARANLRPGMAVGVIESALDGLVMHAEGVGDGADRPVLGVEEAPDLGPLPQGDHRPLSAPRLRAGPEQGQAVVTDPLAGAPTAGTAQGYGYGTSGVRDIDGVLLP